MFKGVFAWLSLALVRVRQDPLQTLTFAAIGALTGQLTQIPQWFDYVERRGMDNFFDRLSRETIAIWAAALFVAFAFRIWTGRAADLLRRPGRFFILLLMGTLVATTLAWWITMLLSEGRIESFFERPDKVFEFWKKAFLWGGLIVWLYLLSMERSETRAALAGLLGRRSLLARQLANARLGHARAQIDPSMVARVLDQVHARYLTDAAGAGALLDHLISYLRLAMNRVKTDRPGMLTEMALIRSLIALRGAEQGITIALHERGTAGDAPPGPLFLVVAALLDALLATTVAAIQLDIVHAGAGSTVVLRTQGPLQERSANGAGLAALTGVISRLLPAGAGGLQYSIEAGVNQYVVNQIHG